LKLLASVLLVLGCLLVMPAAAMAVTYTVDSVEDEPDLLPGTGGCLTAGAKCTLRAAIEESNFSTGTRDEIKFSAAFDGQPADTIVPLSALPAIKDPVSVLGGDCIGEDGPNAPCAGVKGPSGAAALTVENANGVVIEGLAITGAQIGIDVVGGSEGFVARNDWIGLSLIAAKEANLTGIFLDPHSDGATIGGLAASERNVIAGNEGDGLDLNGASDATIEGNYFGVNPPGPVGLPGGSQQMANGKDIEITDSTSGGGVKAENNEVGATIEGAALTSPVCDGGCNVISGANGAGIDLNGNGSGQNEAPASGPTTVHGNYVGLGGDGETVVQNAEYGILAGAADHVQVGGSAKGDANFIAGGGEGIVSESGGEDFEALGNEIGFAADGSAATPPTTRGIFVLALSVTEPASIEDNDISMVGGVGIEQRFKGARIINNNLEGGSVGIWTKVEPGGGLIAGNVVEAAEEFGILVESPDNEIRRNSVFGSGKAGVRVKNPPGIAMTGDLIGGNTAERENVIEGSGGPAIEILEEALEPGSSTEIARNRGSANKGLFIGLVNGANEGIVPPTFTAATQSKAEGTAEPKARIRVFRKKAAEAGELESFLEEATADGSGNWKVTYPASIPGGTIVAATQTSVEGATSELSTAITATEPSSGGGTTGGGSKEEKGTKDHKGKGKAKGKNGTSGVPDTRITKGPRKTHSTTVKFKFVSNVAGSKFECKLDRQKFKPCKSPKKYKGLKAGKHVFKVRAVKGKNVDPTPAKRKFKVLK
jgi:CSLREA domain-containing protein